MMRVLRLATVAVCGLAAAPNHGYASSKAWLARKPVVLSKTGEELVSEADLPTDFDWRSVGGVSYVTGDLNQHIPEYCGSCWVHGTVSSLNDRIKILRKARYPDVMLGRQSLNNCVPGPDAGTFPGCDGGDAYMIHNYMFSHRVPDDSCLPYQARNMGCTAENVCRNCVPPFLVGPGQPLKQQCFAVDSWVGYKVREHGSLSGETAMMKEIYARGPIPCNVATDADFALNYQHGVHDGVYVTNTVFNASQIDHVISVAGWGQTEAGQKYWVIRNSWGTFTGHLGWVKLRRGVDQNLIESGGCDWAVPDFSELDTVLGDESIQGDYVHGVVVKRQPERLVV